jgi:hypothetical protein
MFAVGGRLGDPDRLTIRRRLDACIHNPRVVWLPAHEFVVTDCKGTSFVQRFEGVDTVTALLPLEVVEKWAAYYLERQQYRKGWAFLTYLLFGRRMLPHMDAFQWEGFPHRSRLWMYDLDREILLPTPVGGPVTGLLSIWFALNGGLDAPRVLAPDFPGFLAEWFSMSGPYVQHPFQDYSPQKALEIIQDTFADARPYPAIGLAALRQKPPKAPILDGVAYVGEEPLCRVLPYTGMPVHPTSRWGQGWLEKNRTRLPEDLYLEAMAMRTTALQSKTQRKRRRKKLRCHRERFPGGAEPSPSSEG